MVQCERMQGTGYWITTDQRFKLIISSLYGHNFATKIVDDHSKAYLKGEE